MRKNGLHSVIGMFMIACLLTGCGGFDVQIGENGEVASGEVASGGAVSGGAVSGEAVSVEKEAVPEKRYAFCNDDNFYYVSGYGVLQQCKLDGTKVSASVPEEDKIKQLCWVDNEWIYYTKYRKNEDREPEELWRVPVRKGKEGDQLQWDKKEKIFSKRDFTLSGYLYVEDDSIIYRGYRSTDLETLTNYYKLDLNTKEETPLWKKERNITFNECFDEYNYIPAAKHGISFFQEERSDENSDVIEVMLYFLDLKKWEAKEIYRYCYSRTQDSMNRTAEAVSDGETIFFLPDACNVWQYRKGEAKAECLISGDDLKKKVEELNPWGVHGNIDSCGIREIYLYKGRVYLQLYVEWKLKEPEKKREIIYTGEIFLSCAVGEAPELRYEKEIAQFIRREPDNVPSEFHPEGFYGQYVDETDFVMLWLEEDLYVAKSFGEENEEIRCFNIETGKSRVLSKKDKEYRRLFYIGYKKP